MESTDTRDGPEKSDERNFLVRSLFSLATIVTAAMVVIGFAMLIFAKVLGLREASRSMFYICMYSGAIGFFVATVAHLLLDIMYGVLGLLHVRFIRLLGWAFLITLSLLSLAGIFAASRLAEGLQS